MSRIGHWIERVRPSRAVLIALCLLFGYGAVVVGFLFRVGGVSGLQFAVAVQAASVPAAVASALATNNGRPELVPAFALALVCGATARVAGSVVPRAGIAEAVSVALLVCLTLAGFAVSWAILGYVSATAWNWRRRARVQRQELFSACTVVLVGSAFACVSYGVAWTFLVVGLGDAIA